jgi:N-acetylneuraminate synthase/N,N'-diacetyllegionaminate synthase
VHEIFKRIELPREWHRELAEYARKRGLIFLSSPFDEEAVDLLDELGVPAFKVASGELTNFPLIRYMARKGKPLIVSTGAATINEIEETLSTIRSVGNKKIVLLHCVASYPTAPKHANLSAINFLRRKFKLPVGYSDHTLGTIAPLAAVAIGARMIEKHFTLSRRLKGPDHFYALEPGELKAMVETANSCPMGASELIQETRLALERIRKRPKLIPSFFEHAGLPLTGGRGFN